MKNLSVWAYLSKSLLIVATLKAQRPEPAQPIKKPIVLWNATIHTAEAPAIPNAALKIEHQHIAFIKPIKDIQPQDTQNVKIIDVSGKHIYPGIIAMNTILGLREIDLVRATHDFQETGMWTPNVRALIAFNTDSKVIPTVRFNGILLAEVAPRGKLLAGKSAVVQLDAWNWEDAAVVPEAGLHLYWSPSYKRRGWWADPKSSQFNKEYEKTIVQLTQFFQEAQQYCRQPSETHPNLAYQSLCPVFEKRQKLFIHALSARDILEALHWAEQWDVAVVLVAGAAVATPEVLEAIKQQQVAVVYTDVHHLPLLPSDSPFAPSAVPALLKKEGILFALSLGNSWEVRNLPFAAGTAQAWGLDSLTALQSITLNPAKILDIDHLYGSLAPGKRATLIVSEGSIMDMATAKITMAFIDGRPISLESHQKTLYERYLKKYQSQGLLQH